MSPELADLIERFQTAKTPRSRNKWAIALADTKQPEVKAPLVQAIRDPATKGARGSLVYALSELECDCGDIVADLVGCVIDGSWEEVVGALDILGRTEMNLPPASLLAMQTSLRQALADSTDWRRESIEDCLSILLGEASTAPGG